MSSPGLLDVNIRNSQDMNLGMWLYLPFQKGTQHSVIECFYGPNCLRAISTTKWLPFSQWKTAPLGRYPGSQKPIIHGAILKIADGLRCCVVLHIFILTDHRWILSCSYPASYILTPLCHSLLLDQFPKKIILDLKVAKFTLGPRTSSSQIRKG